MEGLFIYLATFFFFFAFNVYKNDEDAIAQTQIETEHSGKFGDRVNLGNGYYVQIEGNYNDLIKFYHNDVKIADDNLRNGNNLTKYDIKSSGYHCDESHEGKYVEWGGNGYPKGMCKTKFVSVRHGTERDLVCCYAIIDDVVYKSQTWRDIGPGSVEGGVAVEPTIANGPSKYLITGFKGTRGVFTFDYVKRTWECIIETRGEFPSDCVGSTERLPNL